MAKYLSTGGVGRVGTLGVRGCIFTMLNKVALLFWIFMMSKNSVMGESVQGKISIPLLEGAIPPLRVVLDGGKYSTFSQMDGSFIFPEVASGLYVLEVISESYMFSQYKIKILDSGKVQALEYKYPGANKQSARHPLQVDAHLRYDYFEKREKFGWKTIVQNPAIFMLVITGAMVFFMPKMMESMDPEEMKQMQESMGGNDPQQLLKNMFGGGNSKEDDDDDD